MVGVWEILLVLEPSIDGQEDVGRTVSATGWQAIIVPLVLLLIAGFLYASFGQARQAILVVLDVPFALVGGIATLWLRGLNLNLSASIGFIALFCVAVLNGVVLLAYINQLRDAGKPLREAVRKGAGVRLRPVLMTPLVASFGFLPMALSTSPGSAASHDGVKE
jgi:cobalt-zinc-cadmium resistance protein CzcA